MSRQPTGMRDQNGRDIHVGDIVSYPIRPDIKPFEIKAYSDKRGPYYNLMVSEAEFCVIVGGPPPSVVSNDNQFRALATVNMWACVLMAAVCAVALAYHVWWQ